MKVIKKYFEVVYNCFFKKYAQATRTWKVPQAVTTLTDLSSYCCKELLLAKLALSMNKGVAYAKRLPCTVT